MYIHVGGEKVIRSSDLIAIFDLSIEQESKISKQFLAHADKHKRTETIGEENPKSVIVTRSKIYYSPISSTTLKKRAYTINNG